MTDKEKHRQFLNLLLLQDKNLGAIYRQMAGELSVILRRYKVGANSKVWHKNAQIKKEVDAVLAKYRAIIFSNINMASASAWELSDKHNDSLVQQFTKGLALTEAQKKNYFYRNTQALTAFQQRSKDGYRLSDRVWNLTEQTRDQLETFIGSGLTSGRSAASLAKDIQGYLKEPDKRFRRVRNPETGKLILSAPGKDYHPGQGVYRSSYKNALRLTRNEINIAYRTADVERRKSLDFVTGIQVHLSPAHPAYDICDELQGEYPKGFVFTGWHVNCLCFTTSKLLSRQEFIEHTREGKKVDEGKYVKTIPPNAAKYLNANSERIKGLSSKPYFIQDNFKSTKDGFELKGAKPPLAIKQPVKPPEPESRINLTDMIKGDAPTNQEVKSIMGKYAELYPDDFRSGLKEIKVQKAKSYMMQHSMSYSRQTGDWIGESTITLSSNTFNIGSVAFNPLDELKGAFGAIKGGAKLTFNQEYAVESLWHEILHAKTKTKPKKLNKLQIKNMETVNQFTARHTYSDFLERLGGKASNKTEILENGYGYKSWITEFRESLKKLGVSEKEALDYLQPHLMNDYSSLGTKWREFVTAKQKGG